MIRGADCEQQQKKRKERKKETRSTYFLDVFVVLCALYNDIYISYKIQGVSHSQVNR